MQSQPQDRPDVLAKDRWIRRCDRFENVPRNTDRYGGKTHGQPGAKALQTEIFSGRETYIWNTLCTALVGTVRQDGADQNGLEQGKEPSEDSKGESVIFQVQMTDKCAGGRHRKR